MEVTSRALDFGRVDAAWFAAACFTNLSHEHLDDHGSLEAYFAAKLALFDPDAGWRRRDQRRRCLRRAGARPCRGPRPRRLDLRGRGSRAPTSAQPTSCSVIVAPRSPSSIVGRASTPRVESQLIGAFNVAQRARGGGHRARRRVRARRGRAPGSRPSSSAAHRARRRRAAVRGARRLRARPGRARRRAGRGPRLGGGTRRRPGDRGLRLRRRPRPVEAPAHGRGRRPGRRRRGAHLRQPTVGGPAGDRRRGAAGLATAPPTSWSSSTGAPRSGHALRTRSAGDVVVIAGKGPETGQTIGDPHPPVRRPRRRA